LCVADGGWAVSDSAGVVAVDALPVAGVVRAVSVAAHAVSGGADAVADSAPPVSDDALPVAGSSSFVSNLP
jgi:hypothetical protein